VKVEGKREKIKIEKGKEGREKNKKKPKMCYLKLLYI
jgi:hypothetical protein